MGGNESKTMDSKHSPKDPTSCTIFNVKVTFKSNDKGKKIPKLNSTFQNLS